MKILFVDSYYPKFIASFRKKYPNLGEKSYELQKKALLNQFFGTSDSFSYYFRKLGWKADDLIVNDEWLQKKWASENNLPVKENKFISKLQSTSYAYKLLGRPKWIETIALDQFKKYKPDIVYMQDLRIFSPEILKEIKKSCRLLAGQIASPLPPQENLKCFDLIITSFPHFVEKFRKMGIKSEYQKLAFDPRVLAKVGKQKRKYDVTFIGSFSPYHKEGTKILESLAKRIPVNVWGQGLEFLSPISPLRKNYHGEAWGLAMYKILAESKIVINRHITVADGYANNMRLYEATGMGAMLLTDKKKNLGDIFKIGKEVVDYEDGEDLVEKVKYFLKNDQKRQEIAAAGQKRTLESHNYLTRMGELIKILERYERK